MKTRIINAKTFVKFWIIFSIREFCLILSKDLIIAKKYVAKTQKGIMILNILRKIIRLALWNILIETYSEIENEIIATRTVEIIKAVEDNL